MSNNDLLSVQAPIKCGDVLVENRKRVELFLLRHIPLIKYETYHTKTSPLADPLPRMLFARGFHWISWTLFECPARVISDSLIDSDNTPSTGRFHRRIVASRDPEARRKSLNGEKARSKI